MKPQPMKDAPAAPGGKNAAGFGSYFMKPKVCATCGGSTKGSFHSSCRRVKGVLLVVEK